MRSVRRLVALCLIAALGAPPALGGEPPGRPGAGDSAAVRPAESPDAQALLTERIASAGPDAPSRRALAAEIAAGFAWPDIVAVLGEVSGDFRRPELGAVLSEALGALGGEKLHEMLACAALPDADPFLRVVALQTAGRAGSVARQDDLYRLGAALSEAQKLNASTRHPWREAVRACLEARPEGIEGVRARWISLDPHLREVTLQALEGTGARLGTHAVSRLLGTGASEEAWILERLVEMPFLREDPLADGADRAVHASTGAEDPAERRFAARVLGRIGGPEHTPRLLEMLADADGGVVDAAGAALGAAVGASIVADAELWKIRLAEETAWAETSMQRELDAVRSSDTAVVRAALGRLARHRLFRERTADAVRACLLRDDAEVRIAACNALGELGAPASIPHLRELVVSDDPELAAAASVALAAISGRGAPKDPADWASLLL